MSSAIRWIYSLLDRLPAKRHRPDPAALVYGTLAAAARHPDFYRNMGIPDTFQGRFEVLVILLHAVNRRLVRCADDDPQLARRITERFVADMDDSLRRIGVSDVRVGKSMKTLYRAYGGRVAAYDVALAGSCDELEAAVTRNVFPDGAPAGAAAALSRYIRRAQRVLERQPAAQIAAGGLALPKPGDIAPPAAGSRNPVRHA